MSVRFGSIFARYPIILNICYLYFMTCQASLCQYCLTVRLSLES